MNIQNEEHTQTLYRTITLILTEKQFRSFINIKKEKNIGDIIIMYGKGAVNNYVLNFFGIENQNVIVTKFLTKKENTAKLFKYISEELKLHERNNGIAYVTSANTISFIGDKQPNIEMNGLVAEGKNMYNKLTVIVNRGMANDVIDVAREAGARGGTILHGRGTGSEKTAKLFGIEIEPEKELVIMILKNEITDKVVKALHNKLEFDMPGTGILFLEPIIEAYGLVEGTESKE